MSGNEAKATETIPSSRPSDPVSGVHAVGHGHVAEMAQVLASRWRHHEAMLNENETLEEQSPYNATRLLRLRHERGALLRHAEEALRVAWSRDRELLDRLDGLFDAIDHLDGLERELLHDALMTDLGEGD